MDKLKVALAALWTPLRRIVKGKEPAIASAGVGIAANFAAHYGFHLSGYETTELNAGLMALLGWLVRQQVVPLPDVAVHAKDLEEALPLADQMAVSPGFNVQVSGKLDHKITIEPKKT